MPYTHTHISQKTAHTKVECSVEHVHANDSGCTQSFSPLHSPQHSTNPHTTHTPYTPPNTNHTQAIVCVIKAMYCHVVVAQTSGLSVGYDGGVEGLLLVARCRFAGRHGMCSDRVFAGKPRHNSSHSLVCSWGPCDELCGCASECCCGASHSCEQ